MEHRTIVVNGAALHVATVGEGPPLLLLHGWPEFWLTWEPVMTRLADRFRLIAPDLRGFGDSDKPEGPYGPEGHAADMLAVLSALGVERAGVVGHDVGGAVMQPLARRAPERLTGLMFFDFVYPGVGARMGTPDRLNEIWYQSFHQMAMAPALVGATRESCARYIGHFLEHWSHRKDAFDDVREAFVDNFLKAGQSRGRVCALSGVPCRPGRGDDGIGGAAAADRGADLRAVGGARSAVPVCLDRPAGRDVYAP